jgi:hypothetical protein
MWNYYFQVTGAKNFKHRNIANTVFLTQWKYQQDAACNSIHYSKVY